MMISVVIVNNAPHRVALVMSAAVYFLSFIVLCSNRVVVVYDAAFKVIRLAIAHKLDLDA